MSAPKDPGRDGTIITFYSYKGGTGRTMTLANVAWVLASNGFRVLMVDWDLEAPGLHRFFHPFLVDKELVASPGILDMVWDFSVETMRRTEGDSKSEWYLPFAEVTRYVTSVEWTTFKDNGRIDLLPAGKQGSSYATKVNSFDWRNFYEERGGGIFLNAVRDSMRHSYDYTLIDSRTGVSDTSGICTVQLPDSLVVCFTLATQGIEGAAAAAQSVMDQRLDDFRVLPVPMRIEDGEQGKLEAGRRLARVKLGSCLATLEDVDPNRYWGEVEVPYRRFYAYEEILATFGDLPHQPNSVLGAVERLTGYLTKGQVVELIPPTEEQRRERLLQFERGSSGTTSAYDTGLAAFAVGDLERAEAAFLSALREAERTDRPNDVAGASLQLSAVAKQMGKNVEAASWLQQAQSEKSEPDSPETSDTEISDFVAYVLLHWATWRGSAVLRVLTGRVGSVVRESWSIMDQAETARALLGRSGFGAVARMQQEDSLRAVNFSEVRDVVRFAAVIMAVVGCAIIAGGLLYADIPYSKGSRLLVGSAVTFIGTIILAWAWITWLRVARSRRR